jgi:hypothetical protein
MKNKIEPYLYAFIFSTAAASSLAPKTKFMVRLNG